MTWSLATCAVVRHQRLPWALLDVARVCRPRRARGRAAGGRRHDRSRDTVTPELLEGDGRSEVWNSREAPEPGERLAILEAFAAASSDALLSHDADGRITTWNRSAERIFGYREGEILGRSTTTLFPGHLQEELGRVYDTVRAGDQVDHLETEVQRKDGMPIPVSLSIRPVARRLRPGGGRGVHRPGRHRDAAGPGHPGRGRGPTEGW